MLFVGIDWGETTHAVCLLDEAGTVLAHEMVPDTSAGIGTIHTLIGDQTTTASTVLIGIETDHGLLVTALCAAGYQVYAINPHAASHYRARHRSSGTKSDGEDARMLAEVVRLDRQHHRLLAQTSPAADALQLLARSHQRLVWERQRHCNQLRITLREFYPAALAAFATLDAPEARVILRHAPTPAQGRRLTTTHLATLLRRAGRQRRIEEAAAAIQTALRSTYLEQPPAVAAAGGAVVTALVAIIDTLAVQAAALEADLTTQFQAHPDAELLLSLPGLGPLLGARVLAEFGDDPYRFRDSKARKCFAGTAPITRASGLTRSVVRRPTANRWLLTACHRWAFCSLQQSPGARAYYDTLRARGKTNQMALRALANRWVGILHGCLRARVPYDEATAWPALSTVAEPAPSQDKSLTMTGKEDGSPTTILASA